MKAPLLISFLLLFLSTKSNSQVQPGPETNKDSIFVFVEEMPEFAGGAEAMTKYLTQHIHYPAEAIKKKIEGTVLIQFVVEPDGSITNTKVLQSISSELDAEALRVIKSMPAWKPGRQKGKVVRVQIVIPVKFALN